jgi:hypothetical protein
MGEAPQHSLPRLRAPPRYAPDRTSGPTIEAQACSASDQ